MTVLLLSCCILIIEAFNYEYYQHQMKLEQPQAFVVV